MKKNAGYSLLNKKDKKPIGQYLIQDDEQIQMQEIQAKRFIDQPSYAHLQDYNQDLEQDKLYTAFDDQKPMKKHTGKLPPLQNAYKSEEKPKTQAYSSNFQTQNQNVQAQKVKQESHHQKMNESVLSQNLNQSTYYNPYQNRPNVHTTVIYQNQNPSVIQSMIPASLSCYMNYGPRSVIVNPNANSNFIQQQPNPSIPMMLVACKYCTLQQNVPSKTKVFKCWGCRNNTECEAQYGSFICYNCHKKIGYQYGISELIRCSVCTAINQVSKYNPKSVLAGNVVNPQNLSQREELQFKQDRKMLGNYNGKKNQVDEIVNDIEDDDIIMVEHDGYRY